MPKAVGIVRVSQTKGRGGDSFHSPTTQRERIADECERQGLELVEVHEELDVSGGNAIEARPGLRRAIQAIEAGEADTLIAAYLDRLTRSVRVREEVIERVERAGGTVLTVDMGVQSNDTASQWLTGTLSSAVGEYLRRTTAERSAAAQQRAIDRGVCPWPSVPPGYKRTVIGRGNTGAAIHGPLEPDPTAPVIRDAFKRRADGAPIREVRDFLRENGVKRSYHGVQQMLCSRVYLGEVHFGSYVPNLEAHPALIDRDTWNAVQRVVLPRGRKPKSLRLLARLGVLRCGTCDSRMVVGTTNGYPLYRCPPVGDCPRRVTISARIAEEVVVEAVKDAVGHIEGHADSQEEAREAAQLAEEAQAELDNAIRNLAGLEDEPTARNQLAELRDKRDVAKERAHELGGLQAALTIRLGDHWHALALNEQRAIIRATVARATVVPGGRGRERIRVKLFREEPAGSGVEDAPHLHAV